MLSIITPVLNGEKFIVQNIEAIKNLDIPHEHIIVDGGSTDRTIELIKKYHDIILLEQSSKSGMYGAINQGVEAACSNYVSYINCDDVPIKDGFLALYKVISEGKYDLVYGNSYENHINKGKYIKIKSNKFGKYFLKNGYMPFVQPGSIFTKNLFIRLNGFNFTEFNICGDLDFFQRAAFIKNINFRRVNKMTSIFLKYGNSLGDMNNDRYSKELKKLVTNYNFINRILFKLSRLG